MSGPHANIKDSYKHAQLPVKWVPFDNFLSVLLQKPIIMKPKESAVIRLRVQRFTCAIALRFNSTEHKIFSADKYKNANNSWHFHIY